MICAGGGGVVTCTRVGGVVTCAQGGEREVL